MNEYSTSRTSTRPKSLQSTKSVSKSKERENSETRTYKSPDQDSSRTRTTPLKSDTESGKNNEKPHSGVLYMEASYIPASTYKKIEADIKEYNSLQKIIGSMEEYRNDLIKTGSVPRSAERSGLSTRFDRSDPEDKTVKPSPIRRTPSNTRATIRSPARDSGSPGYTVSRYTTPNRDPGLDKSPNRSPEILKSAFGSSRTIPSVIGVNRGQSENNPVQIASVRRQGVRSNYRDNTDTDIAEIARLKMPNVCFTCNNSLKIHQPVVDRLVRRNISMPDILSTLVIIRGLMRSGPNAALLEEADEVMEGEWEYENGELLDTLLEIILGWKEKGLKWNDIQDKLVTDFGISIEDLDDPLSRRYCCRGNIMTAAPYYIPGKELLPINKMSNGGEAIFDEMYPGLATEEDEYHPVTKWTG